MLKKVLKLSMVSIMIVGILFSIFNFASGEIKAAGVGRGAWVYNQGVLECMGDGNDCNPRL